MTRPLGRYIVIQPIRGTRIVDVVASSKADAVRRAWNGEGTMPDTRIDIIGRGRALAKEGPTDG